MPHNAIVTFNATLTYDLDSTDTKAKGEGANLAGDSNWIVPLPGSTSTTTNDIDSQSRPTTGGWDIRYDMYQ
jgi:hypothetical protein